MGVGERDLEGLELPLSWSVSSGTASTLICCYSLEQANAQFVLGWLEGEGGEILGWERIEW